MNASYAHLGGYSDWRAAVGFEGHARRPDRAVVRRLASEILTLPKPNQGNQGDQAPADVRVERRWTGRRPRR
jgi:hypothetical protein